MLFDRANHSNLIFKTTKNHHARSTFMLAPLLFPWPRSVPPLFKFWNRHWVSWNKFADHQWAAEAHPKVRYISTKNAPITQLPQLFIHFQAVYPLGKVARAAALKGLEIPHGVQQPVIALLVLEAAQAAAGHREESDFCSVLFPHT